MYSLRRCFLISSILSVFPVCAFAHHGRDFFLVQDYLVPAPFAGIVYGNFEYASQDGPDEWTLEPGVTMGIAPGLSLGTTVRFADEGNGWEYSSISPHLQIELTPQSSSNPVRFAFMAGYELARERGPAHAHQHAVICGPEYGPDAPSCDKMTKEHDHSTRSHGGIHQHGVDAFFARLIMEADVTAKDTLVVNILNVTPDDGESAWGYAAGWRHSFHHDFAIGVETIGDFNRHGYHEATLATYFSPGHRCTIKLGLSAGLTEESPDFALRSGVVWRF